MHFFEGWLYIACQSQDGNLEEFFNYDNQPHGLHPFSKWAISEEGTEGRPGEIFAQSQTKIAEPNRECNHSRLCYHSDVTNKNSAPSTSPSMLHLHIMSKNSWNL